MKRFSIVISILTIAIMSYGQQALWVGQDITSPEVNADNSVTFRYLSDKATDVQLIGDFLENNKAVSLSKNENGIWEYTSEQLNPELYFYSFIVNGLKITDPNNVYSIRDVAAVNNIFVVNNKEGNHLYSINDVPHGTVSKRWYDSYTIGMNRRITIYTPFGYETSKKNYPVFYLLHGRGGDEEAWATHGRATQIFDNLIAQGKAEPMIVVMSNGNVVEQAAPGEAAGGMHKPTFMLENTMEGSFESSFTDIVNFVDQNYRTIKKKEGRAIGGLSMGGYHSLHISKLHPDMFNYVGLFSAAIFPKDGVQSPVYDNMEEKLKIQFLKKPKLYWIAIGSTDFLYNDNVKFRELLDKSGYQYTYRESDGGHIWKNWRMYLSEFTPMLFK